MTNPTTPDIVVRLGNWCIDYDKSKLPDAAEPMRGLPCSELREAAREIVSLRVQLRASEDRAQRALRLLRDKSQESISSHFNHATAVLDGKDWTGKE